MEKKKRQPNRLEDYQPRASRKQIFGALSKVTKASKSNGNGTTSRTERKQSDREVVNKAIKTVIKRHLGAFKELERY